MIGAYLMTYVNWLPRLLKEFGLRRTRFIIEETPEDAAGKNVLLVLL